MRKEAKQNNPEVTPAQIEAWKKKYGEVFVFTTADGLTCYLRRPTRQAIALAASTGGGDMLAVTEIILENSWLGGDERIMQEDKYFLGLSDKIGALIEKVEGELKKV